MAISVDVSANVAPFKQGMNEAAASVKTFDAALKKNEQELKQTGNAEQYLAQKASLLRGQISAQQAVIANAEKALTAMTNAGINPASTAYQNMMQKALGAQSSLAAMQTELAEVESGAMGAATSADQLTNSVGKIGKNISFDVLIKGIDRITSGLKNAAKKAVNFGKEVYDNMRDAAKYADDLSTKAISYNVTEEELQRMEYAAKFTDVAVDDYVKAREKLLKGISAGGKVTDLLASLGISTGGATGKGGEIQELLDINKAFWDTGEAIMNIGNYSEQEAAALEAFGKSWDVIRPMFAMSADDIEKYGTAQNRYKTLMENSPVVSDDSLSKLKQLQDSFDELDSQFLVMKETVLASLAPALTELATSFSGLIAQFNEYAKTPEGQEALQGMSDAFSSIFANIADINFGDALEGVKTGFKTVSTSMEWISNNSDAVITGLKAVMIGWAGLKLTGGALQLLQIVNGISGLTTGGAAAGAAAGAAWGAAFAAKVVAAAPWLVGLVALLTPGKSESQNIMLDDGTPTSEGWEILNGGELERRISVISERYRNLSEVMGEEFYKSITNLKFSDDNEMFAALEEQFKLTPIKTEMAPDLEGFQADLNEKRVIIPASVVADDIQIIRRPGASLPRHANALPFVPYDGYLAYLDRGERIMSASQNRSYTANSNMYVNSMVLNNGMDADSLLDAMNSQTRATMAGFGSR